ncbi:MAG: pyridoxamine 5'-phosphate oxidase family protein [Granulosicoccus sp.]|nr:pyridoxamine 5'-phosphate oxidase family protein [Granulosicoccus sp.]
MNNPDATEKSPERVCSALIQQMRSLHLATISEDGKPHSSYAPYIHESVNTFYIYVSQLAAHTRHLSRHSNASIMIVADEQDTTQIFARPRVYYECDVFPLVAEEQPDEYERLLDTYQQRHGKMVGLLRQLPDFRLFRLVPTQGQFVMGFGQAYKLSGADLNVFDHTRTG